MTKQSLLKVLTAVALLTVTMHISAQGEWRWANFWTGNDNPIDVDEAYNYVVDKAFDEEGNIYVLGSFGGQAILQDQEGEHTFSYIPTLANTQEQGLILVKFDTLGYMVWNKTVKNRASNCKPYSMLIKDNKILIAGEYFFNYDNAHFLWFYDTLINKDTYNSYFSKADGHGSCSFFSTFDLDGTNIDNHFACTLTRNYININGERGESPLADNFPGNRPICQDSQGNTYLATSRYYTGVDSLPFTIVVDGVSYDYFLPGNCCNDDILPIYNFMIYKFSPSWELEWMKLVVDHTVGVSPPIPYDTINPFFIPTVGGLSIDENDDLYFSGTLESMVYYYQYQQYPMQIYWDSVNHVTVSDTGLVFYMPFIIKYDSDGNVLWTNQPLAEHTEYANLILWRDNLVKDNSVYLTGEVYNFPGEDAVFYFDNINNIMPVIQQPQATTYFVRFNKETGKFESCGTLPGTYTDIGCILKPSVINNHLLNVTRKVGKTEQYLCHFNINGEFERADTIYFSQNKWDSWTHALEIDDKGHILFSTTAEIDINFGNEIALDFEYVKPHRSHAVIALRYDPSILEPYPEDSTGVASYHGLNNQLKLYPNPVANTLFIENEDAAIESIAILDVTGKEIFHQDIFDNRSSINVSSLPDGMYIVKALCNGSYQICKFVKSGN